MRIGIIGGNGFLGSEIYRVLSGKFDVSIINRESYRSYQKTWFDVLINSNGNSKRYIANSYPIWDFNESVLSTYNSIIDFNFGKYIYISSSDVYTYIDLKESEPINPTFLKPYGFNKYISELGILRYCRNYLILRCSAIVGNNLKKGVIFDYINNRSLHVSPNSKLQFISNTEIAKIILFFIETPGNDIFNVGGIDQISVGEFLSDAKYKEKPKLQNYRMNIDKLRFKYSGLKLSRDYVEEVLCQNGPHHTTHSIH